MSVNETIQQMLDSGVAPLSLTYEKVGYFDSKRVIARSMLEVNSLELGKLTPQQYKVVAGRSKLGGELLRCQLVKVIEGFSQLAESFGGLECVTIPILSRTFLDGSAEKIIFEEFEKNPTVSPAFICFELSSDILFEDADKVKARLNELRDLGIKLAICEVGDEYFPIFRLKGLPFEYAFADSLPFGELEADDETVGGLPEFLHLLGMKVFAPRIAEEKADLLKQAGYNGYSSHAPPIELMEREEVDAYEEE